MTAFHRVRSVSSALGRKEPIPVAIGLGTNLGDRAMMLRRALEALLHQSPPMLLDIKISTLYETEAMLAEGAPPEWNQPFLNIVAVGETMLSPAAMLYELKRIEHKLGRQPRGHWAPREIDLDILAYGDVVMQTPVLVLPHAHLISRAFTLVPLAELWPHWRYPVPGPLSGTPLHALSERNFPDGQEVGMKALGRLEGW